MSVSQSKVLLVLAALAAGAGLAGYWWSSCPSPQPVPPPLARPGGPVLEAKAKLLIPGVYLLGHMGPNAAYVVDTPAGLVLIDTCTDPTAEPIRDQLRDLGLDVRKLHAILLTHAHADHSLGARRLRELSGAKVYAGRADCGVLRDGGPREAYFSVFPMDVPLHPTRVDVELGGGEVLDFGGVRFEVIATPGHTPGSVCYLAKRDGKRVLFAGDTIVSLTRKGPYTGLGTYSAYLSPRFRGSAEGFRDSLRKLRTLPVPDLVLPGHPRAADSADDPHLSQPVWEALLDAGIAEMEALLERYQKDGRTFLDGHPKAVLPGLSYLGNYAGSALYALATPARKLYLFDAPGGDGLPAALKVRLRDVGLGDVKPDGVLLTSCDAEATRGLKALLTQFPACVVHAPRERLETVRKECPPGARCRAVEDRAWDLGVPVEVVALQGRGTAPVAYAFEWHGKRVLVSGRTPVKMGREAALDLIQDTQTADKALQYLATLDLLSGRKPDVWLPAVPVHEQNAFLYGGQWKDVLDANREAMEKRHEILDTLSGMRP